MCHSGIFRNSSGGKYPESTLSIISRLKILINLDSGYFFFHCLPARLAKAMAERAGRQALQKKFRNDNKK